ncbi:MAG: ICEBs1 excisionase [Eubacteriales bacterium]
MKMQYMTAQDVSTAMGISRSKAYQIIKSLNEELKEMGYITVAGKCPIQFFKKKYYGFGEEV